MTNETVRPAQQIEEARRALEADIAAAVQRFVASAGAAPRSITINMRFWANLDGSTDYLFEGVTVEFALGQRG